MNWILIVLVLKFGYTSSPAIATAQFADEASCRAAAAALSKEHETFQVLAYCAPGGAPMR